MFDCILQKLAEANYVPHSVKNQYRYNFETRELWNTADECIAAKTGHWRNSVRVQKGTKWLPTPDQLNLQSAWTMLPVTQCNAVCSNNWQENRSLNYFCSKAYRQRPTSFGHLWHFICGYIIYIYIYKTNFVKMCYKQLNTWLRSEQHNYTVS